MEEEKNILPSSGTIETKELRTLVCCIGRKENQYIREFVEYHKAAGFTNICLFDNNYDGEDDFREAIGDYIDSGYVILKDYRNRKVCQNDAYNECYQEFKDQYDWIAFFDCDEFITFGSSAITSVSMALSDERFKDYDMIHINWLMFEDSGLIQNDGRPVMLRFQKIVQPLDFKRAYDNVPENFHIKSIVRGGLDGVLFNGPHTPSGIKKCCNALGNEVDGEKWLQPFDYSYLFLRHYSDKTIEEYIDKITRGFPDQILTSDKYDYLLKTRFFKSNKPTREKLAIIKERLGLDLFDYYHIVEDPDKFDKGDDVEKRKDVQLFMLCFNPTDYGFVNNEVMTPLQCGAAVNDKDVCKLKDNTGDNISQLNPYYVENTGLYWIWKNVKDAKYKGQTQYRRRFTEIDETTDFDKLFSDYDIICCKPYNFPENAKKFIPANTIEAGYGYSHCIDDLKTLERIVKEVHPDYASDWDKYIKKGENLYYSNGFILPSEEYDKYCEFLFDLLERFMKRIGVETYEDLVLHIGRNLGAGRYIRYDDPFKLKWHEVKWQAEICGFLSERILTLYIQHNFPRDRRYEIEYTKMEDMPL